MRKILLIIQCMPTAAQMWRRSVHNIKFMKFNIQFNENMYICFRTKINTKQYRLMKKGNDKKKITTD